MLFDNFFSTAWPPPMKFRQSAVFCCLVALQDLAEAFQLGLQGSLGRSSKLRRRGNIFGSSSLSDSSDVRYYTNVSLNGQSFQVLIDTGRWDTTSKYTALTLICPSCSSDLWVAGSVSNAQGTGKSSSVSYAVGEVQGTSKPEYSSKFYL